MSDILAAARAHYDRLRGQTVEVPEWGTEGVPAVVHFDPPTLRARQALQHRANKSESRLMAFAVILWAKTADGTRMFKDDALTLAAFENDIDPAIIARVAGRMLGISSEDALGN
jgi:hypothetical protein